MALYSKRRRLRQELLQELPSLVGVAAAEDDALNF